MDQLLPLVLQHIEQTLAPYGDAVPFGVSADTFLAVGMKQFEKRFSRIERARSQTLDDVQYGALSPGRDTDDDAGTTSVALPPR
jgi:ribonucleoside-diphosphate reductase beta chain